MTDPTPPCPEHTLALHAFADGELDVLSSLALEEHLRRCAHCRAALDRIEKTRGMLAGGGLRQPIPEGLRQTIIGSAAAPKHIKAGSFALAKAGPWLGGGAMGALAASLALFLLMPTQAPPSLADALIDSQIRSLQSGHLVDVETSDRHTVKPWFNGRITFAPPVVDLKAQGFALVGGRLDVVGRENIAVLVFRDRLHTINLFIRPARGQSSHLSSSQQRAGYSVVGWIEGGLEYWAVSDVGTAELEQFRTCFLAAAPHT